MPRIEIDEQTDQPLREFAMPGESSDDVVRRSLRGLSPGQQTPSPVWLARAVSAWLAYEGISGDDDAPYRLAVHILNNWEMVRGFADEKATVRSNGA